MRPVSSKHLWSSSLWLWGGWWDWQGSALCMSNPNLLCLSSGPTAMASPRCRFLPHRQRKEAIREQNYMDMPVKWPRDFMKQKSASCEIFFSLIRSQRSRNVCSYRCVPRLEAEAVMWREGRGLKQDHLGRLVSQGLKMALAYTAMLTHTLGRICVEWTRERNRVILMDTTPVSAADQQRQGRQPRPGSVIERHMRSLERVVCA